MKKTINKNISSTKFYNIYKSKGEQQYFFVLPTIGTSPKKNLHWDITIKSYFFGFLNWFIQYNVYEVIGDSSTDLSKENFEKLKKILRQQGLIISNMQDCLTFIRDNIYIVQVLKNTNHEHPYVSKILSQFFMNQSFVDTVKN